MTVEEHLKDLRRATEPSPGRLARIRAGRPPRRPWWVLLPVVLAAAGALLLWPRESVEPALPDEPVAARWAGTQTDLDLGAFVTAHTDGHGQARGTARDIVVDWVSGSIDLEVQPHAGVQLAVDTPEGRVQVTGTAFSVVRDPLGTAVGVRRGSVQVTCTGAEAQALGAGQELNCLPTTAVAWLRRVSALQRAGRHQDVVIGVDAALGLQPDPSLDLELRLHRATALLAQGKADEASTQLNQLEADYPEATTRIQALRPVPERGSGR